MNKLKQLPLETKAFILFSTLVSIIGISLPEISRETYEKIITFTGWIIYSPYPNILILYFLYIFFNTQMSTILLKISMIVLFSISMYSGYQGMKLRQAETYNNPYLTVSEYRYIWIYIIPIFWTLIILFSPILKCKKKTI